MSPPQKSVDEFSENQDKSGALVLTEDILDQSGQHCLSTVREIEIKNDPTSKELMVVKNVLPFITHPYKIEIDGSIFTSYHAGLIESMVSNIHFSDNLHCLKLDNINLTASCANEIASSLHQAGNLDELAAVLGASLARKNELQKLDISHNALGHRIIELANHLDCVPSLRQLNLEKTVMGAEEVFHC